MTEQLQCSRQLSTRYQILEDSQGIGILRYLIASKKEVQGHSLDLGDGISETSVH